MARKFNIRQEMYLTVEEDIYGSKQLYAHTSYGGDLHPIEFGPGEMRLLLDIMEMALAATPAVHRLGASQPDSEPDFLNDLIRNEHEIIRHANRLLAGIQDDRKRMLKRRREKEEQRREEQRLETEREIARQAELNRWREQRALWQQEREQWEADRAQWQAAQPAADAEGPETD